MEAEYLVHHYYNDDLSLHSLLYHKVMGNITYTCCIVPFNTEGRRATCTTRKATQAEIVLYFN
jgi:hypothetical protein